MLIRWLVDNNVSVRPDLVIHNSVQIPNNLSYNSFPFIFRRESNSNLSSVVKFVRIV